MDNDDDVRAQLVADITSAIWCSLDAGFDEGEVRDAVDQALKTWESDDLAVELDIAEWAEEKPAQEAAEEVRRRLS